MARSPFFLDPSDFQPGGQDIVGGYEDMIRGGPRPAPVDDRQMGLMGRLRDRNYPPAVPRGTSPGPYAQAMGAEEEPTGPPQQAERVPETGGAPESRYRDIADQYLQSLTQPYRLPEPAPYSKREKLGMLAAREPWQREMIVSQHREPYERAMAEAQIGERRRSAAAGVASDLEKAGSYERARRAVENRPSQELDYVDKVEKAQADVGNADYPYTKPQWKALAQFKAQEGAKKAPATKEAAMEDIDREIRADEGRYLQATSDPFGAYMPVTDPGRGQIVNDIQGRRATLQRRRKAIAGMTPDIYAKFRNLTAEQQDQAIAAYEKRQAGAQAGGQQPGPVAPSQPYYP